MERSGFRRKNQPRGFAYSLEQFEEKYRLEHEQAEQLYYRFGPSSVELDLLMEAKGNRHRELPFVGE